MPQDKPVCERTLRGRVGAHALHAQGKTNTRPAREALHAKFVAEVDPDGTLPPRELAKRVEHAKKLYYSRLALRSARARRVRRGKPEGDAAA